MGPECNLPLDSEKGEYWSGLPHINIIQVAKGQNVSLRDDWAGIGTLGLQYSFILF